MNTMKRKERKKSILYRYIASYVSIVLLSSCVLISFSSYSTAARLNAEIRQHQNYQLSLLADDLQRRFRHFFLRKLVFWSHNTRPFLENAS